MRYSVFTKYGAGLVMGLVLSGCITQVVPAPAAPQPAPAVTAPAPPPTAVPVTPQRDLTQPDARGVVTYPDYQAVQAQNGDTISSIANRVGISPQVLGDYNGLPVTYAPRAGDLIILPPRADRYGVDQQTAQPVASTPTQTTTGWTPELAQGAIERSDTVIQPSPVALPAPTPQSVAPAEQASHVVAAGETVYSLSRLYNVPVDRIAAANSLGDDFVIIPGQRLIIPIPAQPGTRVAVTPPPSANAPLPAPVTVAAPLPSPALTDTTPSGTIFLRPVDGPIIRAYGEGGNEGIDIAAPVGTDVRAADAGEVALVSRSIGELDTIVMIRHANNLVTVYGRITGATVARGDQVARGQIIGQVAERNNPNMQFQVRQGIDHVDPAPYL